MCCFVVARTVIPTLQRHEPRLILIHQDDFAPLWSRSFKKRYPYLPKIVDMQTCNSLKIRVTLKGIGHFEMCSRVCSPTSMSTNNGKIRHEISEDKIAICEKSLEFNSYRSIQIGLQWALILTPLKKTLLSSTIHKTMVIKKNSRMLKYIEILTVTVVLYSTS